MKIKKFLLLLILPLIFIFTGCTQNDLEKVSKNLNTYTMDITYNNDHTFNVKQTLSYTNRSQNNLDKLMLHLYPKSFRQGAGSSVVSNLNYSKCYYNGETFGDIEITTLKVNNIDTEIIIEGNDDDILSVPFCDQLSIDNSSEIYLEYVVTLPNINHRFGYNENTINMGNFYPIACVYEENSFVTDSYHYNGDPFYSDMANYNVTITIPSDYKLASTGNISSSNNNNNSTSYNISARTVRDFAFVISDNFKIVSDTINDIKVNYYYYNNQYPEECLQAGRDAIETFSRLFGEYPYNVINIVEAGFVHGGMEYPNMVLISDEVDVQSDYINVIVHEVAHQWWYGLVGNNEYNYGWLDEGLTEYSTLLFYEENPSYNVDTKELIKNTTNSFVTFVEVYKKVFDKADTTMNRKLNEYNNESEYVYIAYVKGMLIFDNIRELIGKEKFIKCVQQYFKDNKYSNATPDNLITSFEKASSMPLREVFESWIDGKVQILQIN